MMGKGLMDKEGYASVFENQGRLFGMKFSEGLANPTVIGGVADAYEKWLIDPEHYQDELTSGMIETAM